MHDWTPKYDMVDANPGLHYTPSMKVTVELSDQELKDVLRITGLKAKGPAIRSLLVDSLNLRKRRELDARIAAGEWSIDFPGFEKTKERNLSWD